MTTSTQIPTKTFWICKDIRWPWWQIWSFGKCYRVRWRFPESSSFPRCCVKSNPISGNYMKNEFYHSYVSIFCEIITVENQNLFWNVVDYVNMLPKLSLKVGVGGICCKNDEKFGKIKTLFYQVKEILIEP